MDLLNNVPVVAQIAGATAVTVGFGLWLGPPAAWITGGLCAIIGGTVADVVDDTETTTDDDEVTV